MPGSGTRTAIAAAVVVAVCAHGMAAAPAAYAHIVLGDRTLQLLLMDADVAVRARITDVREVPAASGLSSERPTVGAAVLEVLKGDVPGEDIRFAQHGHGVATYRPGEDVLLFLRRTTRSRELDALAKRGIEYVSLQEHDEKYIVPPGVDPPVMLVARAHLRAAGFSDPDARRAALGQVLLTMLRSGDARLAAEAVQGLALAGEVTPFEEATLAHWVALLDDEHLSMGVRLGLLVELSRRGFVAAEARWITWLETTTGSDRTAVIRAARRHPSPAVGAALIALLVGDDPTAAREAAMAVGWPGYTAAVEPLGQALESDDAKLRMAAIRGLGAIGTRSAVATLESAARDHPDEGTRRRAGAEARRLGTPAASEEDVVGTAD